MSGGTPPLHMRAHLQPGRCDGSQSSCNRDGEHAHEMVVVPVSREVLADVENAVSANAGELFEDDRERAHRAAESLARRQKDQEKLRKLSCAEYSGPEYEIFAGELAAYAYPIIMSWLRRGVIWKECADRGRPLNPTDTERETIEGDFDERIELAFETVAEALRFFVDRVLRPGRWSSEGGAAITTYFIGSCLLVYPNVFRRWRRSQRNWQKGVAVGIQDCPEGRTLEDLPSTDPAAVVTAREAAMAELRRMPDGTRDAVALVMDGMSFAEAGEVLGISERAVEGRLYRYRQKRAAT